MEVFKGYNGLSQIKFGHFLCKEHLLKRIKLVELIKKLSTRAELKDQEEIMSSLKGPMHLNQEVRLRLLLLRELKKDIAFIHYMPKLALSSNLIFFKAFHGISHAVRFVHSFINS